MLLGFNIKGEDLQSIQSLYKSGYSVTQNQTIQPRLNLTTTQNTTLTKEGLKKKVYCQVTEPSYVNGEENLLKWNKEIKQFELTLTNTKIIDGMSANATVKTEAKPVEVKPIATQKPEAVKPQTPEVKKDETVKVEEKNVYLIQITIRICILFVM